MNDINLTETGRFMLRVYAIILNEQNQLLLSDEIYNGVQMTKFPGGGLEFGEGTLDCLHREAMEEFGQEIEITDHFYTTDFYQQSRFHEHTQLISIYYIARFREDIKFKLSTQPFDFKNTENGEISFRWKSLSRIEESEFTFPIDQHVLGLLKKYYQIR